MIDDKEKMRLQAIFDDAIAKTNEDIKKFGDDPNWAARAKKLLAARLKAAGIDGTLRVGPVRKMTRH